MPISACLFGYYTLFFTALSLPKEEILFSIVATYLMHGFYKNNKKIVGSLNNFSIE
mgnify:CR=1 FL=1